MKTNTAQINKLISKLSYDLRNTRVNSKKWHTLNDNLRKIHVSLIA